MIYKKREGKKEMNESKEFKPFVAADKVMPEFSFTSVITGIILAVIFGGANAYLGLRVGMTVSASVGEGMKKSAFNGAVLLNDTEVISGTYWFDLAETLDPDRVNEMVVWKESQQTTNMTEAALDLAQSPIKPASGWAAAPADAKEFTLLLSKGLIRRPALILKTLTIL